MTPERLRVRDRAIDAIDAIVSLGEVAGNHSRFLFDFSPESMVLRLTADPAPRLLYCFRQEPNGSITAPELARRIRADDIEPSELYIGGPIAEDPEIKALAGIKAPIGIKQAAEHLKKDLQKALEKSQAKVAAK
jgi:CRISPR-associated protein Cst2